MKMAAKAWNWTPQAMPTAIAAKTKTRSRASFSGVRRRAETYDRHGPHEREGAGDVGADDHHDEGHRHPDQDDGLEERFGIGVAPMSRGVELGDGQGEQGARRQSDGQIISGDRGDDLDLAENLLCNLIHASLVPPAGLGWPGYALGLVTFLYDVFLTK